MLSSISASASTATATATSERSTTPNWLEKLRSSKGFPSSTHLDLDQFLAHRPNHDNPQPNLRPTNQQSHIHHPATPNPLLENHHPTQQNQLFTVVTNVLSELFCMGGDSSSSANKPTKKCSRKQTIPKFCLPSDPPSDFSNNTPNYCAHNDPGKIDSASPMSDDNSGVGPGGKELADDHQQVKLLENVVCLQEGEEEDEGYGNLSGFSRTEVTVIDTSFASWKFDKMLFRKKNAWKVRDKKGQFTSSEMKKKMKRKAAGVDSENVGGELHRVKKPRALDERLGFSKKGSGGAFKKKYHQNDKSGTASGKISFSKSLKKKQSTLNLENGGSSVVLIKNIPTAKKSGTSSPRSCQKLTQRQVKV